MTLTSNSKLSYKTWESVWSCGNSVSGNLTTPCGTVPGTVAPHLTPDGTAQGAGTTLLPPSGMLSEGVQGTPIRWPSFSPFFTSFPTLFPAPKLSLTMPEPTYSVLPGHSQTNNNPPDFDLARIRE